MNDLSETAQVQEETPEDRAQRRKRATECLPKVLDLVRLYCEDMVAEPEPEPEPTTPKWATETPEPADYSLTMYVDGGRDSERDQYIAINRAEFIALKERLAELRGYARA